MSGPRGTRRYGAVALLAVAHLAGCREATHVRSAHAGAPSWEEWADATTLPNDELDGWIDTTYRYTNANPAYPQGGGPTVCVDERHFNYHTAGGISWPFAELLRGDGFRVSRFRSALDSEGLEGCRILVIANAQAAGNTIGFGSPESNWAYPHGAALTNDEITGLLSWVQSGGALLLIADHAPLPAAVSDLALLLGAHMLDAYALASPREKSDNVVFGTVAEGVWLASHRQLKDEAGLDLLELYRTVLANPGTWASHAIVEGRSPSERVDWIVAFGGQAFQASDDWMPIAVYGPDAVALVPLALNFDTARWGEGPLFSIGGWLHSATRRLEAGRVTILGEGGMCTAQFDDLEGALAAPLLPYGFNAPYAPDNAQFCLNVVHWLAGLFDE